MPTNFANIQFNKASHGYTLNGRRLTSVTKIISQLKPPFDADYWSQKKADERGVTKEVILQEWDAKRQASIERGDRVHDYIQKVLLGLMTTPVDPFLALNTDLPEMRAFDTFWGHLAAKIKVRNTEFVIGDEELGLAGTTDALFYSLVTEYHHVWDWKTGEKFKIGNRFGSLLPPFDDLDDCEWIIYSLQTSLYRLIIERNTHIVTGDSYILHLDPQGTFTVHQALDLRERLLGWLKQGVAL